MTWPSRPSPTPRPSPTALTARPSRPSPPRPASPPGGTRARAGGGGVARGHHHGCVALVRELFPQLDQELDAWEAEHGWLYR
ncbi:MAG: hypothetical protein ACJ742_18100 [Actinomycetes bacterium]